MLRLSSAQVSVRRMLRPALSPPKGSHRSGRCSPVRSSRGGSRRPSFDSAQDRLSCREPTRPWILRRCSGQVSARQLVGSVMRERIFSPALSCVEGSRALPRAVAADPCPEHFDCAQCKLRRRDADDLAALDPSIALRTSLEGTSLSAQRSSDFCHELRELDELLPSFCHELRELDKLSFPFRAIRGTCPEPGRRIRGRELTSASRRVSCRCCARPMWPALSRVEG